MKCYIVIDLIRDDDGGEVDLGGAFLDRNDAAEWIRSQWNENSVDDFIVEVELHPKLWRELYKEEKKNES
jgi:hypothetical protein